MAGQNERTQPNDDQMPVDKPGDRPENHAPVGDPKSRGDVPERDPASREPDQQAPTDPDIAQQGHIEAKGPSQAVVDAANGDAPGTVQGP